MTLKLTIEYVGTAYHGWQIQPGVPTVQGILQERLAVILRESVRINGAARTDAGVHAEGQVASLVTNAALEPRRLLRSLNALLPGDIAVRSVEAVSDRFHARHSALGRTYRYQVVEGGSVSPFLAGFSAHAPHRLDLTAMEEAAALLVGRRDFSSFRAAGDPSDSSVKEIRRSSMARDGSRPELLHYTVEASSFLQYMVRNIAGTLLEVGRGRLAPTEMARILEARDRRLAGPTAPARGLFLVRVQYPHDGDLA